MKCNKCGREIGKKKFCGYCGNINNGNCKRILLCVILGVLIVIAVGTGIFVLSTVGKNTVPDIDSDYVCFSDDFTDVLITDEESAIEAVATIGDTLGIKDASNEFKVAFTNKRETETYYRLQQYYNGIPVFGRNITVVADEGGESLGLTSNYSPIGNIDTEPSLNEEEIYEKVYTEYGGVDSQTNNGLIVYNLYESSPTLAYDITVRKSDENEMICEQCIISAENGDILLKNNLIRTDITHSSDEYTYKVNDDTYLMYDESRNILILNSNKELLNYEVVEKDGVEYLAVSNDGKRNENPNPLWDKNQTLIYGDIEIEGSGKAKWKKDAVNLINGIENTYDFYSEILKWNGFDNSNSPMLSSYNDFFYSYGNNAYSQGNLLVFGYKKDLTDVGLIGHEFNHSVENSISDMNYSGESGAIMEAYADIFGELAEDYAKDGILNDDCDWIHGSRNMKEPSDKYPTCYMDDKWLSTIDTGEDSDYGNVHTNNTVLSHAAYLMSKGVGENAKIDNKSLSVMLFNSLNLLQKDADFSQCRNAVELSARIMMKNKELTEEQYRTVQAAFDSVGIENATFTYIKTVKNEFDLSVLNSKANENVNYTLEVIKMPVIKQGPNLINNEMPKVVVKKTGVTKRQILKLKDGTYVIRVTDESSTGSTQPISTKIIVNGEDNNASDEVIIYTDFTEVITVVVDNESNEMDESKNNEESSKLTINNSFLTTPRNHTDGIPISSVEDMKSKIKNNTTDTFYLTDDIDFANESWNQIEVFGGKIYGNGYVIKNLTLDSQECAGLFRNTENAEIYDLGFENANIDCSAISESYVGLISAFSNSDKIDNCFIIDSNIRGSNQLGAFFAYTTKTKFSNLYTNANLSMYIKTSDDFVQSDIGGITGSYGCHEISFEDAFTNCIVESDITANVDQYQYLRSGSIRIGGIVGDMNATSGSAQNPMGPEDDTHDAVNVTFNQCKFNGNIYGDGGQAWNSTTYDTGVTSYDTASVYAGGIIGYAETDYGTGSGAWSGKLSIINSSVDANIKSSSYQTACAGGVVGSLKIFNEGTAITIDNVSFNGQIETTGDPGQTEHSYAGSIAGCIWTGETTFSNITASGTITDHSNFGTNVGKLSGLNSAEPKTKNVDVSKVQLKVTSNAQGSWKKVSDLCNVP